MRLSAPQRGGDNRKGRDGFHIRFPLRISSPHIVLVCMGMGPLPRPSNHRPSVPHQCRVSRSIGPCGRFWKPHLDLLGRQGGAHALADVHHGAHALVQVAGLGVVSTHGQVSHRAALRHIRQTEGPQGTGREQGESCEEGWGLLVCSSPSSQCLLKKHLILCVLW